MTDPEPAFARAEKLFNLGSQYYAKAEYTRALEAFLDAQTIYPSADFQYNIGACYEQLEQYDEAARAYGTYLRNARGITDRANIENKIQRMERLAEATRARREAAPQQQVASPAGPQPIARDARAPGRGWLVVGIVGSSLGIVGGTAAGLALGLAAGRDNDAIVELGTGRNPDQLTQSMARELGERRDRKAAMMWTGIGIGATLSVASAAFIIKGAREARRGRAQTKTSFTPHFSRRGIGASLLTRF